MTANLRSNGQASNCDVPSIRILSQKSQVAHDAQPTRQLSNGTNLLFFGRGRRQPSAVMVATNKLTGLQIEWNNTCGWLCKQTVVMLAHCKHFTPYLHRPLVFAYSSMAGEHELRESQWSIQYHAATLLLLPLLFSQVLFVFMIIPSSSFIIRISSHHHSTSIISTSPLYTIREF
jgi:hypothetical protein